MIYAIEAVETPFIKFGSSSRGKTRLRLMHMQIGCPYELRFLALCDWPDREESHIHLFLAAYKARGEWFTRGKQTDQVITFLKAGRKGLGKWQDFLFEENVLQYRPTQGVLSAAEAKRLRFR